MVNKLFFRLEHESSGLVEFLEISRDKLMFPIFDAIPSFNNRPLRVSFEGNNYEKSFVPSLFLYLKKQLYHEGTIVASLHENSSINPQNVFVFDKQDCKFPGKVNHIIDEETDSEYHDHFIMNIYLRLCNDAQVDIGTKYLHPTYENWKTSIFEYSKTSGYIFYYKLGSPEPVQVHLRSHPNFPEISPTNHQMIQNDNGELIQIHSFMSFIIFGATDPSPPRGDIVVYPKRVSALGDSFTHNLTTVGKRSYDRLKKCIYDRCTDWTANNSKYAAAIASICQHSGSGKSKMAYELSKNGPGINVVLRSGNEDAFPLSNNISQTLTSLITDQRNVDPDSDRTDIIADNSSKIASILNFISSLLMTYLQELVDKSITSCKNTGTNDRDINEACFDAINQACLESGPRIPKNLEECQKLIANYSITDGGFAEMFKHYRKLFNHLNDKNEVKISHVAGFIKTLLENPALFLTSSLDDSGLFSCICSNLSKIIGTFPFIFVIDEAHQLASYVLEVDGKKFNGFQIFRRALTYLVPGTRFFVLALGTKSVILEMNPPDLDSSRRTRSSKFMPPIVLSGNFDIFSHEDGFKTVEFVPSYEVLLNPLVFKYLVSLGSPIWSSLLLETVIDTAIVKLKNSTVANKEDYFVSWMIRTGIMASPKSGTSELLVAKRMAALFNLAEDLQTMAVFYPSQPVFGIAAREICKEVVESESLFESLLKNDTLLEKDCGEMAECMANMNVMLAIDKSENVAYKCETIDEYNDCLSKICLECPSLTPLWETMGSF